MSDLPLPPKVEELLEKYLAKRRVQEHLDKETDAAVRDAARKSGEYKPRHYKPRPYRSQRYRPAPPSKVTPVEVEVTCAYCKKKFWKDRSVERHRKRMRQGGPYCSLECSAKARTKVCTCAGCGATFLNPRTKPVGIHRKGEIYCSKECYLEAKRRDEGFVLIERPLEQPTYCHHCIDNDATCELKLNGRWMGICDGCRDAFGEGALCASYPTPGDSVPWPKGAKRKPMLHEIERKGSKPTLNTGFMILTLEWVRP